MSRPNKIFLKHIVIGLSIFSCVNFNILPVNPGDGDNSLGNSLEKRFNLKQSRDNNRSEVTLLEPMQLPQEPLKRSSSSGDESFPRIKKMRKMAFAAVVPPKSDAEVGILKKKNKKMAFDMTVPPKSDTEINSRKKQSRRMTDARSVTPTKKHKIRQVQKKPSPSFPIPRPITGSSSPIVPQDVKIILSIDGGGVRAIIPLVYLVEIKRALHIESFKGIIDVLAGTSVGAILCLSIVQNIEERVMADFMNLAAKIFSPRSKFFKKSPNYKSGPKRKVIEGFTQNSGGQELRNVDVPYLLFIPFYNCLTEEAKMVCNDEEVFPLVELLMMTSAAPTYFSPHQWRNFLGIDGGVFANNPAFWAYVETKKRYPNSKIVVISLGTGKSNSFKRLKSYLNKGLLGWAKSISDITISSTSSASQQELDALTGSSEGMLEHIRIQPQLPKELMALDRVKNIPQLKSVAKESISSTGTERERMNAVLRILRSHLPDDF